MRLICCLALVLLLAQAPTSAESPPLTPTEVMALEQQSRPSRAGRAGAVVVGGPAPLLTTACTGNSTKLPAAQCAAWIKFYDGTNGDGWTGDAASCKRNDPCACKGYIGKHPVCNSDGTTVVNMCVRTRLPALPPPPPHAVRARRLPLLPLPPRASAS